MHHRIRETVREKRRIGQRMNKNQCLITHWNWPERSHIAALRSEVLGPRSRTIANGCFHRCFHQGNEAYPTCRRTHRDMKGAKPLKLGLFTNRTAARSGLLSRTKEASSTWHDNANSCQDFGADLDRRASTRILPEVPLRDQYNTNGLNATATRGSTVVAQPLH